MKPNHERLPFLDPKVPFVICGPGHCGMSTTARLMHEHFGIQMGEKLTPPGPANPKGFCEDIAFRKLNAVLRKRTVDEVTKKRRLSVLLEQKRNAGKPWGIEDPDVFLSWEFYQDALTEFHGIYCVRSPDAALADLLRHWPGREREARRVFEKRNQGITRALKGRSHLVIDFNDPIPKSRLITILDRFLHGITSRQPSPARLAQII
jgi:hypothetical protein